MSTFRLDDWACVGTGGHGGALHHDEGLPLVDPSSRPEPIAPIPRADGPVVRALLVATSYLALERIGLAVVERVQLASVASPQVFTCLRGVGVPETTAGSVPITVGETVIVPVGTPTALTTEKNVVLLRGWVPHLAQEVIDPARAVGASEAAIRGLGLSVGRAVTVLENGGRESV